MGDFEQIGIDDSESSLVQLLVKLNIVSQAQVTEALEYQCRLPQSQRMQLEDILVEMEYLTPTALKQAHELLGHDPAPPTPRTGAESRHASQLFGALFSEPSYEDAGEPEISEKPAYQAETQPQNQPEQLNNAEWDQFLNQTAKPEQTRSQPSSQALPEPTPESAPVHTPEPKAVQAPAPEPAPAPAQAPAAPGGFQVAGAFAQRSQARPGNWNVSAAGPAPIPVPAPIAATKSLIGIAKPQLGEILLKNHDIEEWQLTHALCMQRDAPQTTPKLGTLLVKLGYVQPQAVERALSLQVKKL